MRQLVVTSRFKKDYKQAKKRGLDMRLLQDVLQTLQDEEQLDEKYCDHALSGDYRGFRECHIQPDWLLIYALSEQEAILVAQRTGTHSDLFD